MDLLLSVSFRLLKARVKCCNEYETENNFPPALNRNKLHVFSPNVIVSCKLEQREIIYSSGLHLLFPHAMNYI